MTDKEIVQALRRCAEGECKDCAMHEDKQRCQENLLAKAAEAIERLTAENAALRRQLPFTRGAMGRRSTAAGRIRAASCALTARRRRGGMTS